MPDINKIKAVIAKIAGYKELGKNMCFFGGALPYMISNVDSNRDHSDIDILVLEQYLEDIRTILKDMQIYDEEMDSLNAGLTEDYGFKANIDGVYVEFEPMQIKDNKLYRRSFSPNKKIVGEEIIAFEDISDLIVPIEVDGIKTYSQSIEYIKVQKESYLREKDVKDIEHIERMGIDSLKYERIKKNFNERTVVYKEYPHQNKEISEDTSKETRDE